MTITYLGIGLTLFLAGINCAFWAITKFNDLKHLETKVDEIRADVKTLLQGQNAVENRLTKQETKCNERHSRKRKNV